MLSSIFSSKIFGDPSQPASPVEGNTAFALDLYGHLKRSPGNLFFSPNSISTALAMTYAGARGETEEQMARVLHFDMDQKRLHEAFYELQTQLNECQHKGIQLHVANALWAQKAKPLVRAFLMIATEKYRANVSQTDFNTGAEAARNEINQWVAQQTEDRIQNILPPGSIDYLTRLVLANAIYFKGPWSEPFDKAATSTEPFHISPSTRTEAPLMHRLFENVRYAETSDFQALELPYSRSELAMTVLLPREVDGCGHLEERLTASLLTQTLSRMKKHDVEVFLPRFKLDSSFQLSEILATMGMPDAFEQKADFSGMDGSKGLFISGVFHKAWCDVNEEGTEAAAATVVAVAGCAQDELPPPPPVFRVDHPFIFIIRDTRSGSLLFFGRLVNPKPCC